MSVDVSKKPSQPERMFFTEGLRTEAEAGVAYHRSFEFCKREKPA